MGIETNFSHQDQEAPERCTLAPWWMPLGLIIVGGDPWVAWNAVCVSQLMHWGSDRPQLLERYRVLRWEVRPGSSWGPDLIGHQRVRQLAPLKSPVSPGLCGLCPLPPSEPLCCFRLQAGLLCLFMVPLLGIPLFSILFAWFAVGSA